MLVVVAASLAVEAFDHAGHGHDPSRPDSDAALRTTLATGLALIAVYHGLWVVFMLRLF